jgi:hypothetical protein
MQRLLLPILALLALPGSTLLAQNITGTWQGTLKVSGANGSVDVRTVMKISRADNESLKGVFYSIDQDPTPIAMTSVTLKGTTVKVSRGLRRTKPCWLPKKSFVAASPAKISFVRTAVPGLRSATRTSLETASWEVTAKWSGLPNRNRQCQLKGDVLTSRLELSR